MSNIVRIKRSATAGHVPAKLPYGELAANVADRTLFIGNATDAPIRIGDVIVASYVGSFSSGTFKKVSGSGMTVTRTAAGTFNVSVTGGAATDNVVLSASENFSIAKTAGDAAAGFTVRTRNMTFLAQPVADSTDIQILVLRG